MIEINGFGLNQWDTGRSVKITVEGATHAHFANQGDSKAVVKELKDEVVNIPDYLLQTGKQLCVYAVLVDSVEKRVTIESKIFSVKKRPRPADYVYEENQRDFIYALTEDAQAATADAKAVANELREARDAGEFNGRPGEQGPKGDKGEPGSALIDDSAVRNDASWSSLNTIDKLCPSFEKTGTLVQCEPVEGYPLEVHSDNDFGFVLTVCGKNLYNKTAYPLTTDGYPYRSLGSFSTSGNYRRTDFIPVRHLAGQTITLNYAPVTASNPGMAFYKYIPDVKSSDDCKNAFCGGGSGYNTNVPADAAYMCFSVAVGDKDKDIQIELGSTATEYEAYRGKTVTGEPGDVQIVPARKGQNFLFAYSVSDNATAVQITVNGRADPVAIIKKLTQAVLSLGGNI